MSQSVLYQSPYSSRSGWPRAKCLQPPDKIWPSPCNPPGAILRADPKSWKPKSPGPLDGPSRATQTVMTPTQAGRFTVQGPSARGPFSVATAYGIIWHGNEEWATTSGGPGQNLGLG
jgi:hypothetical protein